MLRYVQNGPFETIFSVHNTRQYIIKWCLNGVLVGSTLEDYNGINKKNGSSFNGKVWNWKKERGGRKAKASTILRTDHNQKKVAEILETKNE